MAKKHLCLIKKKLLFKYNSFFIIIIANNKKGVFMSFKTTFSALPLELTSMIAAYLDPASLNHQWCQLKNLV